MTDNENDDVQLSASTLAALQDFYSEQKQREEKQKLAAERLANKEVTNVDIDENWQLSQFWYDDRTAELLAKEALRVVGDSGSIACVSCPTLFKKLREIKPDSCTATLFEFDERFGVYGSDFILYDFNAPLEIPRECRERFDLVVADPPFLSDECLTKTAVTIKFLAKSKIILCTGAIMKDMAKRLLDLDVCKFEPHHENNLANDFMCYANYNLDEFVNS